MAKVKKTRLSVNVAGNEVIQTFDGEALKGVYTTWKTEQGKEGNLGLASNASVLSLLRGHGIVGRGGVGSAVDNTGAGGIIKVLDAILDSNDLITKEERKHLEDVNTDLTYAQANNNPRDIPFRVPVENSYNKAAGEWKWETVHGHYRTPGYVQKRTLPEDEGGDGSTGEAKAVDASWYTKPSSPPMWKALFGPDGFHSLVKELIEVMPTAELSIPMLNVRQAGTAQTILNIDVVKGWIKDNCLKDNFRKQDGTYNGAMGSKTLQGKLFKGGSDDELVKRAAGIEDIEGEVGGYKLNVTPLMMRKIALSLDFKEKVQKKVRSKKDLVKSWTDILRRR